MSNENSSIHDFDFDLICEYFSHVERQGPGSPGATLKALSFIEPLTESARIADIGCGTGVLSLMLAQRFTGMSVLGIDIDAEAAAEAVKSFFGAFEAIGVFFTSLAA